MPTTVAVFQSALPNPRTPSGTRSRQEQDTRQSRSASPTNTQGRRSTKTNTEPQDETKKNHDQTHQAGGGRERRNSPGGETTLRNASESRLRLGERKEEGHCRGRVMYTRCSTSVVPLSRAPRRARTPIERSLQQTQRERSNTPTTHPPKRPRQSKKKKKGNATTCYNREES